MDGELTPDELDELLGAYSLDALDADERALVEAYLRESPRAADEVAANREALSHLNDDSVAPPPELWGKIAAALEERPPPLRLEVSRRRRRPPWFLTVAAAAAFVLIGGVIGVFAGRASDSGGTTSVAAAAARAESDPTVRKISLTSGDAKTAVVVLVAPSGDAWLEAGALPPLTADRTYQLWALGSDLPVSLGVLGPDPQVVAFRLDGPVTALAITDEHSGGVATSAAQPVVSGPLS